MTDDQFLDAILLFAFVCLGTLAVLTHAGYMPVIWHNANLLICGGSGC